MWANKTPLSKSTRATTSRALTTTFNSLVLGSSALSPRAERFEDSRALSDAVANDPNGIGFVGLPYVGSAKALAVSEAGARELLPNRFTVATEDYLLSRRLYLYTASSPKPLAREFVDFAVSKAGQDVVAANAFVAQNVGVEQVETPVEGASNQYRQVTRGAERLLLDFRFRSGSSQLDNKALADIDRVPTLLSDLHYTGRQRPSLRFCRQCRSFSQQRPAFEGACEGRGEPVRAARRRTGLDYRLRL